MDYEASQVPAEELGRLEVLAQNIVNDSELNRRAFLGIFISTVFEAGIAAAKSSNRNGQNVLTRAANISSSKAAKGVPLDSLDRITTTSSTSTTTTTAVPETIPETVPETVPEELPAEIRPASVEVLPDRKLPHETFIENADLYLANIPTLEQLAALFPENNLVNDYQEQEDYIKQLAQTVKVTSDDYKSFTINTDHNTVFQGSGSYNVQIDPKIFVVHWTGAYYDSPEHLATSMMNSKNGPNRVDYYIDQNAATYQLFESDHNRPAHAISMNDFSQGVEVYAGNMMEYTPGQIKQIILLAVDFCRRNNLEVSNKTIMGHQAGDFIFANPFYDPATGEFSTPRVRKFDPPESLMRNVIIPKAMALDAELKAA